MTTCIICDDLRRTWPDENMTCYPCAQERRVLDAVAEERARIVAMLREEAAMWGAKGTSMHWAVGVAVEGVADRIERGETQQTTKT